MFVKAANPRAGSVMGPRVLAGVKEALRDTEQQAPHVPRDRDSRAGKGSRKTSTGREPSPRALCSRPGGGCSQQGSVQLTDSLVPVPRGPGSLTHLSSTLKPLLRKMVGPFPRAPSESESLSKTVNPNVLVSCSVRLHLRHCTTFLLRLHETRLKVIWALF